MTAPDSRTARRRTLIGAGLVAVLAAVLIAIVVVRSTSEKILNENGDTFVLVGKEAEKGSAATIRGELTDVGGCLGVTVAGDERVVIWPHGTTVATPDPLRVTVAGTAYALGDTIEVAGDEAGPLTSSDFFHDKVPAGCQDAERWIANTP
jgi:hypothetical protein